MIRLPENPALRVGLLLAIFAITATVLVALTETQTRERIVENQRQATLRAIAAVVPEQSFDNDILTDTLTLPATAALGTTEATTVYRARLDETPVAAVLNVVAPNGYSGSIHMLVGIYYDGTVSGVRVIAHKETPGLGDKIDERRDDWILQFSGLSLENPPAVRWKVKRDGGSFDQFTGATITPRAVVGAVQQALIYFQEHRDRLFMIHEEPA
ncbi:electron transport complex protein RnfG [Methylophaga lonarensis MPL]|uniref:Ion-translocating oxidoreductase complex subunit G n=1 Tax=Methylophaga lonarensis MPL TaxID=1286106 RepID=M7PQT7_9GAMM|nr:electron transport complex subunit RsxG [Methylophaga lonarensis]EMR12779.1 electron transport complex protein RnfG [Methylophaga lonarensis MPL]